MNREDAYCYIENNFGIARSVMITYFKYLDDLMSSVNVDIIDAPNYLITQFGLNEMLATEIVTTWTQCT